MSPSSPSSPIQAGHQGPLLQVLHIEDSADDHDLLSLQMARGGLRFEIIRVEQMALAERLLKGRRWDLILSDYRLPGFTGLDALSVARSLAPGVPFIIISGEIGEDTAVEAMRHGATDYLLKGHTARLVPAIERALEAAESHRRRQHSEVALAQSRARIAELAQHLQSSIEEERAAMAREIHDEIGGSLAALKFELSWLERRSTQPDVLARVQQAQDVLMQVMSTTQRLMINLRPAVLDQGLTPALQWLCHGFRERTEIDCHLRLPASLPAVGGDVALAVFRTVQEALTNVRKHADAGRVTVDLIVADRTLSVEVSDDGRGWSPADLRKPASFGLRGLHERAHRLGGWLDLASGGQGSTVILSLPLSQAEPRGCEWPVAPSGDGGAGSQVSA